MNRCYVVNLLVFPNQLFAEHPGLRYQPSRVILIEDSLFFGDAEYPLCFHKQKLWLHRATMKRYQQMLQDRSFPTEYLDHDPRANSLLHQLSKLGPRVKSRPFKLMCAHPTDFILEKRLARHCRELDLELEFLPNPGFINLPQENFEYRAGKHRWQMADFYKWQRQRMDVLVKGGQPVGGKWSFDDENRKKVPRSLLGEIPEMMRIQRDSIDQEAQHYVGKMFPDNPGNLNQLYYPTSHDAASKWLVHFLENRLARFGDYEDAILAGESWLWHGVLTPSLNTGLLTPGQVLDSTLTFAARNETPINSLEGFVRQVIGWREFIRATYQDIGVLMRTTNHWNHLRKMPSSFYDGTTGILPIDDTIHRIRETGYCHHIERLMVLGGFMFICEIHPDEIYRWFMEMFVDSYDWVMVPNVYAMSQHADGGMITTKPYFSGSAYIRKMSHYKSAAWCDTWDGLYWRWIWKHTDELARNPRWAMMCSMARKMDTARRKAHLENADAFLQRLDAGVDGTSG